MKILSIAIASAALSLAQTPWDSTGNGLLRGVYNFRQIHLETGDAAGNYGRQIAVWGQINFDGNGNFTLANARVLDSRAGANSTAFSLSGTYRIGSSGYGFLDSPALQGALTFGLVSQGIFVGSTTESDVNDLFVAAPTSTQTEGSFTGQFWVAEMAFPALTASSTRDAFFQINPNGTGGLGNITLTGYAGSNGQQVRQTLTGARYSFSTGGAGSGTLTYGTSASHVTGSRILYVTPDRNFIFGGSDNAFDIFVGVRGIARATQTSLSGLYYVAGLDQDNAGGRSVADSYYGSLFATNGNVLAHQRILFAEDSNAGDYNYSDTYEIATDGKYEDFLGSTNVVGADGNLRIGHGLGTYLGISVAVKAPTLNQQGVFLNPHGVLNAASFQPFTSGLSRGELVRLYGTNLASTTRTDTSFPTTLAGVQVTINNRPSPIYQVSPTEIVAAVPFGTTGPVVAIQVVNNQTASNLVTTYLVNQTPGVFTLPQNGLGSAAALHPDFTVVNDGNPAAVGETIAVYMTGLGPVSPAVADGAPAPSAEPLSRTSSETAALVDGRRATVAFSGLAPGLVGLYQMNITIPTGITRTPVFLDITGPGTINSQVQLPIRRTSLAQPEAAPLERESSRQRLHSRGPNGPARTREKLVTYLSLPASAE